VAAVGVDRISPNRDRDGPDRGPLPAGDRPADREAAAHRVVAQAAEMTEELPGAAGTIGPDQDRGAMPMLIGDLGQGGVEHGDVIGGGVAARVPPPQYRGEELAGVVADANISTPSCHVSGSHAEGMVAIADKNYYAAMTASKARAGRQHDLVGPAQLAHLSLQVLDPLRVRRGGARLLTGVDALLLDPVPQGVRHDPDLRADPLHRRVHRQPRVLGHRLGHHPQRTITQLVGVLPRGRH